MGRSNSKTTRVLPVLPLAPPLVVYPGTPTNVPMTDRPDINTILSKIYSIQPQLRNGAAINLVCVPLNSPLLSPDGKLLIEDAKKGAKVAAETDPVNATKKDLFGYGCLIKVSGLVQMNPEPLNMRVEGLGRVEVVNVLQDRPYFEAEVRPIEDFVDVAAPGLHAQFNLMKQLSREYFSLVRLSALLPRRVVTLSPVRTRLSEILIEKRDISEAGVAVDFLANTLDCSHEDKLRVLCTIDVKDRVDIMIEILRQQIKDLQTLSRSRDPSSEESSNAAIDLRRALAATNIAGMRKPRGKSGPGIPNFLPGFPAQGNEDDNNEMEELKKRLQAAKLPPEADKVAQRELARLQKMMPQQSDYQVCRNYLETLAEIPWSIATADQLDASTLARAKKQLDDDHYGLDKIKKRLLEYLAVLKLKEQANKDIDEEIRALGGSDDSLGLVKVDEERDTSEGKEADEKEELVKKEPTEEELRLLEKKRMVDKSPIMLLVGPPGTGKTSLAKSVATALGRKFHRISLGGVRDEAEIRGHRRTYVAAMPGLIVSGLKKVGVNNPVILLDEIDKLGMSNFHGDPSAAMLEVLDPEQNHTFTDHYLSVPLDLSKVLFIATANSLDTIPPPLLDRMEMIQLSGYTTLEKRHIASRHLIPKQITTNGLHPENIEIPTDVLDKIITSYTRESGVRNLEREVGSVCRSKAVDFASAKDGDTLDSYNPLVTLSDLDTILGIERFTEELTEADARPGVVTGLVAYSTGGLGSILFIEVLDMPGGSGRVQLTGKLGDVLKESVEVALSWVKSHAFDLHLTDSPTVDIMHNRSIHVHCPSGAIPKDGPSAGLAHTVALISLFSGRAVPSTLAMTGEVSLRGRVLPVGGIKEKLIGALRAGVRTVLLPEGNRKDVRELPEEVKLGLEVVTVGSVWEALGRVWPEVWGGLERVESRL